MVKILGGEILFRRRPELRPSGINSWPLVRQRQKFYLDCVGSYAASVLTALEEVEKRRDCDGIVLDFVHLLDDKLRPMLERLFKVDDKSWAVDLKFKFPLPEHVDATRLLNVLAILQPVRYIRFTGGDSVTEQLTILQSLPKFEKLECLDIEDWEFDQNVLQDVLDCPFLPPYTMFCLTPRFPLTEPVFAKETVGYIHSISLSGIYSLEPDSVTTLLQAVALLPVLNELSVVLPAENVGVHAEPLAGLYTWLESPSCHVTNLIVSFCEVEEQISLLLATITKMPLLKVLKLSCEVLHLNFDELLHAISNAPGLSCIYLGCEMDDLLPRKLLKFQIDCRPRMLSIITPSRTGLCDKVSLVYQAMEDFQQSFEKGSFPLSAWPYFLELLGDSVHVLSRAVNKVGLDSIFYALKRLLSNYSWEWKLVVSADPVVQFTSQKMRKRKRR